jgi:HSP20 family molecular chaperone IbpA
VIGQHGQRQENSESIDLIDRENEFLVRAELPTKEDISISLAADSITIQAQSSKEVAEEKGDYRRREISSSAFSRSMWLPVEVDVDAAKAAFKDGVLEVTLPKTAGAKAGTCRLNSHTAPVDGTFSGEGQPADPGVAQGKSIRALTRIAHRCLRRDDRWRVAIRVGQAATVRGMVMRPGFLFSALLISFAVPPCCRR